MHGFDFLGDLVLLSAAAVAVILIFNRLRLPPIVGLIATGLLVGPSGLALVTQGDVISVVSEIGVILLLFTIGLEFSIDDLKRLRTIVFIGGPLQVVLATLFIGGSAFLVSRVTGGGLLSMEGAIMIGMAMALSSTAICTKMLKDRRELSAPHGRLVLGVLIFQDLAVVPMMIIVTLMAPSSELQPADVAIRLATMVGVTLALVVGLRLILPRLIPFVTRTSSPEVLILGGLALCFGTAWVTSLAGISMALGAFIAGVAIGGSDEGHAIGRVLGSMRDAFTSMFFLSIGLLVVVDWSWMPMNLLTAIGVLVINTVVVIGVLFALRVNHRSAVMAAIILAQVGEFSFLLAKAGADLSIISAFDFQNMIVSIMITMVVTPTLISLAPWFAERATPMVRDVFPVRHWYDRSPERQMELASAPSLEDPPTVTIVGGGVLGSNVSHVMGRIGIPYRVLELRPDLVESLRNAGCSAVQGDITDESDLERAGIREASVVIVAVSDQSVIAHGVGLIRRLRPDVLIVARVRYARDANMVSDRGADVVITEEYESSIQAFVTVLEHLGVGSDVIQAQETKMREDRYGVLARLRTSDDSPAPEERTA